MFFALNPFPLGLCWLLPTRTWKLSSYFHSTGFQRLDLYSYCHKILRLIQKPRLVDGKDATTQRKRHHRCGFFCLQRGRHQPSQHFSTLFISKTKQCLRLNMRSKGRMALRNITWPTQPLWRKQRGAKSCRPGSAAFELFAFAHEETLFGAAGVRYGTVEKKDIFSSLGWFWRYSIK